MALTNTCSEHQCNRSGNAGAGKVAALNGIAFHHVSFPLDQN
jgi:hypothetical protein